MPGELQYINITDFTGGLNLYRNQFQLADNESPDMLNVLVDPRVGFFVRAGLQRQNTADVATPATFAPRLARTVLMSAGASQTFITSNDEILVSTDAFGSWSTLEIGGTPVVATANPHLADFASWGNKTYIVCGPANQSAVQDGEYAATTVEPTLLDVPGPVWNDDYTVPADGYMPKAEVCEPHSGYLFTANLSEDLGDGAGTQPYPNRLRWSHPLRPEDYAKNDYIDIDIGGGEITALMSFQDHLVIFKTDSMWALYGYDTDSWQLIKMSKDIGVSHPGLVTRSETALFFFSSSDQGAVWAYDGSSAPVEISESIRPVMDEAGKMPADVWVQWMARALFLSVPSTDGSAVGTARSVYVWDPDVGRGAWTRFSPATDEVHCFIERGDHEVQGEPAMVIAGGEAAAVVASNQALTGVDYIRDLVTPEAFEARYRTGWRDAGGPERRKSWRRPRFILSVASRETTLQVNTYQNYNEVEAKRYHELYVDSQGLSNWRLTGPAEEDGFNWTSDGTGDGTNWNAGSAAGSVIERAQPPQAGRSGLGVCAAVQLEIIVPAGASRWGVDAIILKHRSRRGTT